MHSDESSAAVGFACLEPKVQVGWHGGEGFLVISIRKAGSITILDLNGALKLGESEQEFRQEVQNQIESGAKQLAINLAGVPEMDSSGVGSIVRAFTLVKKAGGRCTFFAPTKRVIQLLKMVRLDSVLDMADDEAAALSRG
jgi:anti-sigma B factor antagonist